ncbi:acyltransferase [Kaistia dalseonensis]|uniref:Peptidoglycan/LPS O-acetylase OafA/YrhL n=1 Tax=Kaistia dalseonensis TaxID=410840 RepID=A0ABU0H8E3_9HYPH|nr:acyltransferase [Kaistia dalseonensis]MCX5495975.1 acyltransferase [Kaistia dalseonensis]MDQ0438578.1 peptidoglycan/LPS O-acetylase OafA/YrhL [Kaistia dalseonensis]
MSMRAAAPDRKLHLDTLRGIACVLLVAYHVIGNDIEHGLQVGDGSPWRLFTELFMHVRMPLFSFLSGYVFSLAVPDLAALNFAIGKKFRRIGIPFVVVSSLFYLLFGLTGGGFATPMWQIYLLPYEHYWYLQATLLIMVSLLVGNFVIGDHARAFATVLFPVACAVFIAAWTFDPYDIFALGSALYLLPYFLLGQLLRLWGVESHVGDVETRRRRVLLPLGLLLAALFVLDLMQLEGLATLDFARQSALGLLFGVTACLFLFFLRLRSRVLAAIGVYSYSIYLFHVFFTAALRKLGHVVWPDMPRGLFFTAALIAGISLPILLHKVVIRHRVAALLLLGIDKRPRRAPLPGRPVAATLPAKAATP